MDRRRWLQRERSERPPNRGLPGAASRRRDGSAQREITFLSNEESGEDQCWLATLRRNCFGMAAAAAYGNGSRHFPSWVFLTKTKTPKGQFVHVKL